ncbi:MAG: hypothetical protein ACRD26_06920 [Vicinamibacterales bacterium]
MSESATAPLVEVRGIQKAYGGLRPLRIRRLDLGPGQNLALVGFDRAAAEAFVNLVTGATVPDVGDVRVFGQPTTAITDADAWLRSLDRFGIVSERAVLVEGLTGLQNLAMPLTLEVDPPADAVRAQVMQLAVEVGIDTGDLGRPVAELSPITRLRVRLGRALALGPLVLLAEHPNASLSAAEAPVFAADFAALAAARGVASITLTADRRFAAAVADEILVLQPATGELKPAAGWRRWFGER